jgi:hypothetical protein
MNHSWLRFASNVTVQSTRPVEECVRSLQPLVAPPNSYSSEERKRPFRGEISIAGGKLRYSLLAFGIMRFRELQFGFLSSASGTVLQGQWRLLNRVRIPVMIYLGLCLTAELVVLVLLALHQAFDPVSAVFGPAASFAMIYGWTWAGVFMSRKAEAQLLRAVSHAMASDQSAKIVVDLLSSPS